MMNPVPRLLLPARARTVLSLYAAALTVLATPGLAAWEENGRSILNVEEMLPRLSTALGATFLSEIDPATPMLCDADALSGDAKALRAVLLQSGLMIDPVTSGIRTAQPGSERARATRRLLPATPFAPAPGDPDAIQSGCVALFGRLIDPPYRLERVGDQIELNGVAIFPAPGENAPPPRATAAQQQSHDRLSTAIDRYESHRGTSAEADARDALLAELRGIPGVTEASWAGPDDVHILRDGREEYVTFGEGRQATPDEAAAQSKVLDQELESLRDVLARDGSLLCGATYLIPVLDPGSAEFRPRVEAITRSNESEALRIARLQAYTLDRAAAADLVFAR